MENLEKITEKSTIFQKISRFFQKINPYQENHINESGKVLETKTTLFYRKAIPWCIDIIINGSITNYILFCFRFQPLNPILILGDGLLIWFGGLALKQVYDYYISGKIRVERSK